MLQSDQIWIWHVQTAKQLSESCLFRIINYKYFAQLSSTMSAFYEYAATEVDYGKFVTIKSTRHLRSQRSSEADKSGENSNWITVLKLKSLLSVAKYL